MAEPWLYRYTDGRDRHMACGLDSDRRPLGLLDAQAALDGHLIDALIVNLHTDAADVAHRLATGPTEPGAPVIATDDQGRYLGLVTVRRLLRHLGT